MFDTPATRCRKVVDTLPIHRRHSAEAVSNSETSRAAFVLQSELECHKKKHAASGR